MIMISNLSEKSNNKIKKNSGNKRIFYTIDPERFDLDMSVVLGDLVDLLANASVS